jgi:hypothetical protein
VRYDVISAKKHEKIEKNASFFVTQGSIFDYTHQGGQKYSFLEEVGGGGITSSLPCSPSASFLP